MKNENGEMRKGTRYQADLRGRLLRFSVLVIRLASLLPKTPAGFALAHQVIRSATGVGANCEEAQDALSRADFLRTINIALKEARETAYWLQVIHESHLLDGADFDHARGEAREIAAILSSSVKTMKDVA